jgi:hypothetical protein
MKCWSKSNRGNCPDSIVTDWLIGEGLLSEELESDGIGKEEA